MQGHHLSRGQRSACRQSDPSSRVNGDEARTRRPSDVKLSNLHLTPWASGFESGGGHDNLLGHGKKILKLSLILISLLIYLFTCSFVCLFILVYRKILPAPAIYSLGTLWCLGDQNSLQTGLLQCSG